MERTSSKCGGSLDANVLLRLILRDIPKQSDAALALLENSEAFHIADTALIETIFALERYYEIGRTEIADIVQILTINPQLVLNRMLFSEAMLLYPVHPRLSIEDCCLACYAKLDGALPLWSFDHKLATQVSSMVTLVKV